MLHLKPLLDSAVQSVIWLNTDATYLQFNVHSCGLSVDDAAPAFTWHFWFFARTAETDAAIVSSSCCCKNVMMEAE